MYLFLYLPCWENHGFLGCSPGAGWRGGWPGIFNKLSMNLWGGTSDQKLRRGPRPSKRVSGGIRYGYPGGYLMGKEWIKGAFCYMSANGWWDRSLNYHMQQIVGNKLWHHSKNWNKNKISLFWLPSLFELCDLSLNCTPGTSGDNFIILHKFRPKHSLWRSKKSFRRLEALERGRPCHKSLVWGSGAWNAC